MHLQGSTSCEKFGCFHAVVTGCFIGKVSGEHLWTPCVFKKIVYHVEEVIIVDNQSTRSSTASKVPTQSWLGTAQWGFMEISIPTNQVLGISRVYYNLCKLHVPFVFMCNYNNYTIHVYLYPFIHDVRQWMSTVTQNFLSYCAGVCKQRRQAWSSPIRCGWTRLSLGQFFLIGHSNHGGCIFIYIYIIHML